MNVAIYREIEVRFEHLPNNAVRGEFTLPDRTVTFECPSEALAIGKAKVLIDKHRLGLLDSATD
jgi:hypothetical protein